MKDAWSSEDVDEDGHQLLQEWCIYLAAGVMIETIAQSRGSFDLDLSVYPIAHVSICPGFATASHGSASGPRSIPVSGVLRRFTTSSIVVPDIVASQSRAVCTNGVVTCAWRTRWSMRSRDCTPASFAIGLEGYHWATQKDAVEQKEIGKTQWLRLNHSAVRSGVDSRLRGSRMCIVQGPLTRSRCSSWW